MIEKSKKQMISVIELVGLPAEMADRRASGATWAASRIF